MAKLSEIRGEAVIDVIADIIEPVINIASDPDIHDLVKPEEVPDGTDAREYAAKRLKRHVPKLIKSHRADVIAILAALQGEDAKEYGENLTIMRLMNDAIDVLADDELVDFFMSQVSQATSDTDSDSISTTGAAPLALA
jgi:hypothetical protein